MTDYGIHDGGRSVGSQVRAVSSRCKATAESCQSCRLSRSGNLPLRLNSRITKLKEMMRHCASQVSFATFYVVAPIRELSSDTEKRSTKKRTQMHSSPRHGVARAPQTDVVVRSSGACTDQFMRGHERCLGLA